MQLVATRKSEQNGAAIDPWTAVHVGAGLALGLVGMDFKKAMALALGYEALEQLVERSEEGQSLFQTSGPETFPNVIIDLVVFAAGHWLGTRWNET